MQVLFDYLDFNVRPVQLIVREIKPDDSSHQRTSF